MEHVNALPTQDSLVSPIGKRKRGDKGPSAAKSPSISTSIDSAPSVARIPRGRARGIALLNVAGGKSSQPSRNNKTPSAPPSSPPPAAVSQQQDPTPTKKVKAAPNPLLQQKLPTHLATLRDMFNALHNVYTIMKKRGLRTTYQAMQFPVQEACGKRFTTTHLAQLQTLLPYAMSLEWIRIAPDSRSTRVEPALLITLRPQPPATDLMSLRDEVHCALARHLLTSYASYLQTLNTDDNIDGENTKKQPNKTTRKAAHKQKQQAEEQDKDSAGEAVPCLSDAATPPEPPLTVVTEFLQPYPEAAPAIAPTALPVNPHIVVTNNNSTSSNTGSGSGGSNGVNAATTGRHLTTLSGTTTTATTVVGGVGVGSSPSGGGDNISIQNSQAGRPPLPPGILRRGRLQQRRLSYSVAATVPPAFQSSAPPTLTENANNNNINNNSSGDGSNTKVNNENKIAAEKESSRLLASMPEELRRRSMDGIISMDTLKALEANELEHTALSSDAALAARHASAALGALPKTFSRLQRIFGSKGPTAMKLNDIVLKIKQGGAETTSEIEIQDQLKALAEYAPEYLTLKPWGSCGTPAVWINRKCNGKEIVGKLKKVAAGRLQQH